MKFEVGQRVKVVKETVWLDQDRVGAEGTIDYNIDGAMYPYRVRFDDGEVEFYCNAELELIDASEPVTRSSEGTSGNVTTIEGVVGDDIGYPTIGGVYIGEPLRSLIGKRVKWTFEVID